MWEKSSGENVTSLRFSVAESTFFRGEKKTEFINCTSSPLSIAKFLKKGTRVAVCGDAVIERWKKRDGTQEAQLCVRVFDVKLL